MTRHDRERPLQQTQLLGESPSRRERVQTSLGERLARPSPSTWLSGQEAAEWLGVSWPTLRKTMLEHDIPHLRLGSLWKIDVAVLDDHLHRIAEAG